MPEADSTPPAKKPRKPARRWVKILVGVVAVLAVILIILYITGGSGGSSKSATDETTAPAVPTTTPTPTATAAPTPASSTWSSFIGVQAYQTSDFAQISAIGVKRVRMDDPSANTITTAARFGITVLPEADFEPWPDLNGGKGDKYPPLPQNDKTWADRMIAQWTSLPTPPAAIEVWNEPWLSSFWEPAPDPVAYYNLVKVFATEAWKTWPNVQILVSSDSTDPSGTIKWRARLLAADTSGLLKDPRIHPVTHNYVEGRTPTQVTAEPCSLDLDRYQCAYNDYKAHGNPNPTVWVTEFGWESGVVGAQSQADYTVQALNIFKNSGEFAEAYSFFYETNSTFDYNWLNPDNSPKPIVAAVKKLTG
jgi:hypothetical protein